VITSRTFPIGSASVAQARRFVRQALSDRPEVLEPVELMVSELATNAVRHADSPFEVVVDSTDAQVRIEVSDDGPGAPARRSPDPLSPSGRGLWIVDLLADQWGVTPVAGGKRVWFCLLTGARPVRS
jgi:anti-sigma regulatory factor (Ser/Thr protein kinase)